METLKVIAETLEYVQSHGGILIFLVFAYMLMDRRMQNLEERMKRHLAVHELYWHDTTSLPHDRRAATR